MLLLPTAARDFANASVLASVVLAACVLFPGRWHARGYDVPCSDWSTTAHDLIWDLPTAKAFSRCTISILTVSRYSMANRENRLEPEYRRYREKRQENPDAHVGCLTLRAVQQHGDCCCCC